MPFTSPPTAVTGAVIESADINVFRDNDNWFNALLPAPGGVGLVPVSSSTSAGSWTQVGAAGIADSAIGEAKLDVVDSPADNEVLTFESASGKFKWQSASAVSNSVPAGLIAAFATAAAIASGWARYTAADGRILVGAGTTFGVTYVENTAYGASWSHGHTGGTHTHSGADLGVAGSTGNESANVVVNSGSGQNVADDSHSHNQGSLDVSGNTSTGGVVATSSDAWAIPSHAVVWSQKS